MVDGGASARKGLGSAWGDTLEGIATAPRPVVEAVWQAGMERPQEARFYLGIADRFLRLGDALLAYEVVRRALGEDQSPPRPRFTDRSATTSLLELQALALARSGAVERARRVLKGVRLDADGLGILARLDKDRWLQERSSSNLDRAIGSYQKAFEAKPSTWTGINLATLLVVRGDLEEGQAKAKWALATSSRKLRKTRPDDPERYWLLATAAEANLALQNIPEALRLYQAAAEAGRERWGDLNSTRRNAELLVEHSGCDPEALRQRLAVPNVAVFAGHMVDRPERKAPRFPEALAGRVQAEIAARLRRFRIGVGYSSAACGSDILFLESLDRSRRRQPVELHAILPFQRDEFRGESVDSVGGPSWGKRFEAILKKVDRVETASLQRIEGPGVAYDYSSQLALGLASMKATQLESNLTAIAVWDGEPGDGPGGTHSIVKLWREFGLSPEIIDLKRLLENAGIEIRPRRRPKRPRPKGLKSKLEASIKAMLLADVKGFSKLTESELPPFCHHFMGLVAQAVSDAGTSVLVKNTWGDGLFIVFTGVQEAGRFALDLRERVHATDWRKKGFSTPLDLRIALHAGPVYECQDPIRDGQLNFIGTHVSRAARIEPITPQGEVYASEAFAALARVAKVADFVCDYVGEVAMAKQYGTFPTYHVRRPGETKPA